MSYRIDRPPKRLYVKVDELGPHLARARKGAAVEAAKEELESFGAARIYEYRLVDARPRAVVSAQPESQGPEEP